MNDGAPLVSSAWAAVSGTTEDLPEPDYSNLDLAFDEVIEFDGTRTRLQEQQNPTVPLITVGDDEKGLSSNTVGVSVLENNRLSSALEEEEEEEDYILGTLIVRVVAARDLTAVLPDKGGIGNLLGLNASQRRGGSSRIKNSHKRGGGDGGGANPYASVRFGKSTQRSSQVFDTTDPIWPRGENMFLDVTHPVRIRPLSSNSASSPHTDVAIDASATAVPAVKQQQQPLPSHPGDPPKKPKPFTTSSLKYTQGGKGETGRPKPKRPILAVAIFHANEKGDLYNPSKVSKSSSGDSDDVFLGMAAVDVTTLLTGKETSLDAWLPLSGGPSNNKSSTSQSGSVRIVCEYESSDTAPRPGDMVRFTGYCHPSDLYPLHHHRLYKVVEDLELELDRNTHNTHNRLPNFDNENYVTISYTTTEGWVCRTVAHRFMLMCEERTQAALLEVYHDGIVTFGQRLSRSPLAQTLQDSLQRLPDEGLVPLGVAALQGGGALFQRWLRDGVGTMLQDIVHATNMDGHNDPSADERLAETNGEEFYEAMEQEGASPSSGSSLDAFRNTSESSLDMMKSGSGSSEDEVRPIAAAAATTTAALPNMPSCPITGEPMQDPVVAADGHTYERSAIARWLKTSDKSPLTGSLLSHKNLVPNYMLLSSLQQLDASNAKVASPIKGSLMKTKEDKDENNVIDRQEKNIGDHHLEDQELE